MEGSIPTPSGVSIPGELVARLEVASEGSPSPHPKRLTTYKSVSRAGRKTPPFFVDYDNQPCKFTRPTKEQTKWHEHRQPD